MKKIIWTIFKKMGYEIVKKKSAQSPELFNTFGTGNQNNREIWLKNQLENISNGFKILDAGAGELQYKKYCKHLNYVSQDFGQYNGLGNNVGLQTQNWDNSKLDIVCDITKIPEPNSSFDAIMCIEVFEHIPAPIEAIKEFSRLLKKGGALMITAPFCSLTHFAPYHFYSGFNKYFYEKHLVDHGFIIEEIVANGSFFEYLAQEIQLRIPNQYTSQTLNDTEKTYKNNILNLLEKMNSQDSGSSEMLCFGYHIRARKL